MKSTYCQRIFLLYKLSSRNIFIVLNGTFCNWFLKANLDLFCPRIKIHSKYKHIKKCSALAILMSHYSFGSKSTLILIVHLGRKKIIFSSCDLFDQPCLDLGHDFISDGGLIPTESFMHFLGFFTLGQAIHKCLETKKFEN